MVAIQVNLDPVTALQTASEAMIEQFTNFTRASTEAIVATASAGTILNNALERIIKTSKEPHIVLIAQTALDQVEELSEAEPPCEECAYDCRR